MKRSRIVTALNVLILITLIIGLGVLATVLLTAVQVVPSITIGNITTNASGMQGTISVPVSITNRGPLSISDIAVKVSVQEKSGVELLRGEGGPVTIPSGATSSLPIAISFDLSSIPKDVLNRLVTTSENLTVKASLVGGVPPFATLSGSVSAPFPWGAPVKDLVVGTPTVTPLNATKIQVSVPVSFTNDNAWVPVAGKGTIKVTDQKGTQVGLGSVDVNAPPNSQFKTDAKLLISLPVTTLQTLLFNDTTLAYNAAIDFQSGGTSVFSSTQTISFNWKAPLGNLAIGSPTIQPFNSTHVQLSIPVSFQNRNDFIDLATTVRATISNATSGAVLGGGVMSVNAPHGSQFSGTLVTYVAFDKSTLTTLILNDRVLNLRAALSGSYQSAEFSFEKAVSLNWGAPLSGFQTGQVSVASMNQSGLALRIPVSFANHSPFLGIAAPITISISNSSSGQSLGSATVTLNVPSGASYSQEITVLVSPTQSVLNTLLLNDRTLNFNVAISGSYAKFDFALQESASYQWGAPLSGFQTGQLSMASLNQTGMTLTIPVSFANHSPLFGINNPITVSISNATSGQTLGSATIPLNVPGGSSYDRRINVTVSLPSGALNTLLFSDKTLGFNIQIGGRYANFDFSMQRTSSYQWGAPVKSLTMSKFNVQPFNSTKSAYTLQFNFTNNSPIRVLTATVTGVVLNQSGSQVGTVNTLQVIAPSQKTFSTQLSGLLDTSAVFHSLTLKLTFQTSFGTVVKEYTINA